MLDGFNQFFVGTYKLCRKNLVYRARVGYVAEECASDTCNSSVYKLHKKCWYFSIILKMF